MNPNQHVNRVITIKNIDTNPFEVIYNGALWARLQSGEVISLPEWLAQHAIKHLADQCMNSRELPLNNQALRSKIETEITLNIETLAQPVQLSDVERQAKQIEEMNRMVDIDAIMARKATETPAVGPLPLIPTPAQPGQQPLIPTPPQVGSLEVEKVPVIPNPQPIPAAPSAADIATVNAGSEQPIVPAPEPIVTEPVAPVVEPEVPTDPERAKLYKYATDTLKMNLTDTKTKEEMDKMDTDTLRTTLGYEDPAELNAELDANQDQYKVENVANA